MSLALAKALDGLGARQWGGSRSPSSLLDLSSVVVDGVCHDSRRVQSGDLYVAWAGERSDGRSYAPQAIERGAVAVLAQDAPLAETASEITVPWLELVEPRRHMATVSARVYGRHDRDMTTVGVTGTNGKTTVVFLLEHLLGRAGIPCGRLGTLGYSFGDHHYGGERTTPEASDLFRLLRTMHDSGARALAMEVSSHALAQNRVGEMSYDVAVFTNLTRDHLDYHQTLELYFEAKRQLFRQIKDGGHAVIGNDDEYGQRLADELRGELGAPEEDGTRLLTFGSEGSVRPREITLDLDGIRGELQTPRGVLAFETPLMGHYNLLNLMAAVAVAEALELPRDAVRDALADAKFVPGRLDPVRAGQSFPVLIDFAHTDGALRAALESMRSLWPGRILVVFGCGGERDQGKRPLMGEVACSLADLAIVTSDNPRREPPEEILAAVVAGVRESGGRFEVVADRRRAIGRALEIAARADDWAVLIAGKGHEQDQIVGDRRLPFDDRAEAVTKLEQLQEAQGAHVRA